MAFKSYKKEQKYKDTSTGEIFTGKKITDSSFTKWKREGLKSEWNEFRKEFSVNDSKESGVSDFEVGFINPNNKRISRFIRVNGSSVETNVKTKVKTKGMKNLNLEMGPVSGNEFKLTIMGGIAVKVDGGFSSYNKEDETLTDVTGFTMDFDGAFYKMPSVNIEVGDLISTKNGYGYVTKVGKKKVTVMLLDGEEKTIVSTKSPFGFKFFTKIVSIFEMGKNGESGLFGDMNPMMLMMMSGKGNSPFGGGDMASMMMMSQMMGGGNGLGDLFGTTKTKKSK